MVTEEAAERFARHGEAVTAACEALIAAVDRAHADGLHVPPRASQAVTTAAALGMAWSYNGAGMACPPEVRRQLGV